MFNADTTNLITQGITIVFYLALVIFILASTMALYSFIRFSKDKMMVAGITTTYIVVAVALVSIAINQLHNISL